MKEQGHSLKKFSIQRRFGKSSQIHWRDDKISCLERILNTSVNGHPYFVVVHSPFLEPVHQEMIQRGEEIPYALSGRGVGKTALLEAFVDIAKAIAECEVLAFLDNRKKLTDSDNFFKDFFVEELLKRHRRLRDTFLFCTFESAFRRTGLFFKSSVWMLGTFLSWLVSVLGLEISNYFYDPRVHSGMNNLLRILSQHRGWLWVVGPLLLICWLLYFVGYLETNKDFKVTYSALSPSSLMETRRNGLKEMLLTNPANVFSFLSRRKCLVLVVDDVDYLDSRSFDSIIELFQAAQNSNGKYRACVVLSFNPSNPLLWLTERKRIRELLSKEKLYDEKPESWVPLCITPLNLEQLTEILCDYFGDSTPERLLEIIGKEDPEALQRTGQLLGFFAWLEAVLAEEGRTLKGVREDELIDKFQRYVYKDEREVEEIIKAIKSQEGAEGALVFLKCLLAFQKHPVQVEHLRKALLAEGYNDIALYERTLENLPIRLVQKIQKGNWYYEFRTPYLRHILLTGWAEWKETSSYYITKVFDLLCNEGKWEPEQALKSAPSERAIEILYIQGLFYYQYYGHSDAGYALRFLGLERGGACGKWLSLCEESLSKGENLWNLIFWKPTTFLNPYRPYTSRLPWSPPVGRKVGKEGWFFAPDLLLNTAIAYWLMGNTNQALELLSAKWERIKSNLLRSDYPNHWTKEQIAACKNYFKEVDAEIRLALAKILYHLGTGESWNQAIKLCRPYIRGRQLASQRQVATARFIYENIRHYRHFSIGKLLYPLQFKPESKILEEILRVGRDRTADDLIRLRALYTASVAIWDMCLKGPNEIDHDQLNRLRETIKEALVLLEECRSRPKARPQDVPPGGRAAEAEIFFWQAVFLYWNYLLLVADLGLTVTQYRPTLDYGKWYSRLNAYSSLAKLYVNFVNCGLFSDKYCETLLLDVFSFIDWVNDLLESSSPNVDFDAVNRRLESLHVKVRRYTLEQATDYFIAADTIYRRLGHQQGHAEVLFQRGLMQYLLQEDVGQMRWYELLMKSDQVTNALGFHLDRLYSQLIVAKSAETSNVFYSMRCYQNSMEWCLNPGLGLPEIIAGEVAYRLGVLLFLNVEEVRGAKENALAMIEEARRRYEPYMEGAVFIAPELALQRLLDIHWGIAELLRRKAVQLTPGEASRISLLNRAEDNCNWIINHTRGKAQFESQEMKARVIKADIAHLRGGFETAFSELRIAIQYYERVKDAFWLLQTLTIMCELILSSKEIRDVLKESEIVDYLNKLIEAAIPYKERFGKAPDSLGVAEKAMFFRACLFLGQVWYQYNNPDIAIDWLFTAFDLLTSLGLSGNAILLDSIIREVLSSLNIAEVQKAYEERLIQASLRIDPEYEEADWQSVGAILRRYFPIQIVVTEHLQVKQDCLKTYASMIELGNVQEAISALEKGVELIDEDNPEEIDFELLEKLYNKYRKIGAHEKAIEVKRKLQVLKDVDQSRTFLLLAKRYRDNGWDVKWALLVATDVTFKGSRYYERAREWLEEIGYFEQRTNKGMLN
jgi:hypothetical protein